MKTLYQLILFSVVAFAAYIAQATTLEVNGVPCGDISGNVEITANGTVKVQMNDMGECAGDDTGGSGGGDPGPTDYNLTVSTSGSGDVSFNPSGTVCGTGCRTFASGTSVTLTASADSGSNFSGWSGACGGTSSTCQVTMNGTRSVSAAFEEESSGGGDPAPDGVIVKDASWPSIPRETFFLRPGEILALKVQTGSSGSAVGTINTAKTTNAGGTRLVTLSTEPGDFNKSGPCIEKGGEVANMSWTTIQNLPAAYEPYYCKIQPNSTYYINIKHTSCGAAKCYFYLSAGG